MAVNNPDTQPAEFLLDYADDSSLLSLCVQNTALLLFMLPRCRETREISGVLVSKLMSELKVLSESGELFCYFLCLSALYLHSHSFVNGELLAAAIKILTEHELSAGGPYREKHGVIKDTNLIIYYFLKQLEVPLDNRLLNISGSQTNEFIHINKIFTRHLDWLVNNTVCSEECETGDELSKLLHNAYHLDILVISLESLENLVRKALEKFEVNKSSDTGCMYFGIICMLLYKNSKTKNKALKKQSEKFSYEIYTELKNDFSEHADIKKQLTVLINEVQASDKAFEISLFPYLFSLQLKNHLDRSQLITFGKANVCLWASYTIYDDFLDQEGRAEMLPLANIAMRRSLSYYREFSSKPKDIALVEDAYLQMDRANTWELQYARAKIKGGNITLTALPDYKDLAVLAQRAQAHILGPLLIYRCSLAYSEDEEARLMNALNLYLIAKQIEDDIHDWLEDFNRGHLSWVVKFLHSRLKVSAGAHEMKTLEGQMKKYFWKQGCLEILNIQREYITKSEAAFRSIKQLDASVGIKAFLDKLRKSNRQSKEKYHTHHAFLKHLRIED